MPPLALVCLIWSIKALILFGDFGHERCGWIGDYRSGCGTDHETTFSSACALLCTMSTATLWTGSLSPLLTAQRGRFGEGSKKVASEVHYHTLDGYVITRLWSSRSSCSGQANSCLWQIYGSHISSGTTVHAWHWIWHLCTATILYTLYPTLLLVMIQGVQSSVSTSAGTGLAWGVCFLQV